MDSTAVRPTTAWQAVDHAVDVTDAMAEDALTAMEASRTQYLDEHVPAAERIAASAGQWQRPDLEMRARMVLADIEARSGSPLPAARALEEINAWATAHRDSFVLARSHFLLCTVQYAIGDLPAARLHGIRSVELLPEGASPSLLVDHLVMLAVAYGWGEKARACYRHALELTTIAGDAAKAIGIHNNLAYFTWEAGDLATALGHVEKMLDLARSGGVELKPSARDTIARVYTAAGRYGEAIDMVQPVLSGAPVQAEPRPGVGVLHTEPYAVAECLLTLATALRKMRRYPEAQEAIDRARRITEDRGLDQTRAHALREQSRLHADLGNFRRAYQLHIAFHRASMAVHAADQEARSRLLQASFEADEQRLDSARFRDLAMRDPLTGLYNRRFIDEQLTLLTAQAAQHHTPLSAAIADADLFKRVNDDHSHAVGDQVLQQLAAILTSNVVAPEIVGRLGGEEFVVLLPNATASQAFDRCELIRRAIQDHPWAPLTGSTPVTVSIGVATAPTGQTSPSALLSDADRNLYVAKRSGRNRVTADLR